jgi:predicted lysophospholipase L1 biosynthesis ABC-type transport system permease subunit
MEFALAIEKRKLLFEDIQTFIKTTDDISRLRVREERSSGGNFTDIANTLSSFLGSILYATVFIALSSFIVSFSRFALERRKLVHTLLWIGLEETRLLRTVFWRFLTLFLTIGGGLLIIFAFLPGIGSTLVYK